MCIPTEKFKSSRIGQKFDFKIRPRQSIKQKENKIRKTWLKNAKSWSKNFNF